MTPGFAASTLELERLAAALEDVEGGPVPVGALDVTMYRDDLRHGKLRAPEPTHIPPGGIDGRTVVVGKPAARVCIRSRWSTGANSVLNVPPTRWVGLSGTRSVGCSCSSASSRRSKVSYSASLTVGALRT